MWYLKKTAESVWNASKGLIDKRTQVQKILDQISDCQQQILPTNKLSELSTLTYEVDQFDEIVTTIFEKLKKFQYDAIESQKTLNILVATNYLIKHGATGFVDEFRKYIYMFKKYEGLETKKIYEDVVMQAKFDGNLQKIKSRAHHVSELLSNKEKLLKQKQLSMLVKQKLKLYEAEKYSSLKSNQYSNKKQREIKKQHKEQQKSEDTTVSSTATQKLQSTVKAIGSKAQNLWNRPEDFSIKLEGLLQSYVWKYVDKLDQTIQSASDKVMQQIDKYVNGEHSQFQLEDDEGKEEEKKQKNGNKEKKSKDDDDDDEFMKKLEQESSGAKNIQHHEDLLDFQEVKPVQKKKEEVTKDLL